MDQIIQSLFLIQDAPKFISIAGSSWGIDTASTGAIVNLFNLIIYIFILVVLAPAFVKLNTSSKKFLLIFFAGFAFGALSKAIDWFVNVQAATSGKAVWNANVDIAVEALELLAIILIIIGLGSMLYAHYARFINGKHSDS